MRVLTLLRNITYQTFLKEHNIPDFVNVPDHVKKHNINFGERAFVQKKKKDLIKSNIIHLLLS